MLNFVLYIVRAAPQGLWVTSFLMNLSPTALILLGAAVVAMAQQTTPPPPGGSWNPYVVQGIFSPAPMLPAEFNGTGEAVFDVGNTGSSDIVWVLNQPMILTISFSYGVANVANPEDAAQAIAAVSGPGAEWFSWEYFPSQKTFRATQKATIPGNSRQTIRIAYKATQNSFQNSPQNGYNCNISPPGYTNPQPTGDDTVGAYTYVQALDFSDAPISYGSASHVIDLTKATVQDEFENDIIVYNRYVRFGNSIDPESAAQSGALALGDDLGKSGGLNANDEDGISITPLVPGQQATITYQVSLEDAEYSDDTFYFSAWFDWNRDGDFLDSGERVASNIAVPADPETGLLSGTKTRTFNVPSTAASGMTYARFRIGPRSGPASPTNEASPTGAASYGEVQDHVVSVGTQAGTAGGRIYNDLNGNGVQDAGEPNLANVSVTVTDANSSVQNLTTDANGIWSAFVPVGNTTVLVNAADTDLPLPVALTQGQNPKVVSVASNQLTDAGVTGFTQINYPSWQTKNSTSGGMNADHDHDGVANGIEYFLVGPKGNSTGYTALPGVVKQGGVLTMTWVKAADYAGVYGTDYWVETSGNLQHPWTPQALGTTVTISGNQVIYTFPTPYVDKFFVRLRVSGP